MSDQSKGVQNIPNTFTGSLGAPNITEAPSQPPSVEKGFGAQPQSEVPNLPSSSDNHDPNNSSEK